MGRGKFILSLLALIILLGSGFAQEKVVEKKYAVAVREANVRSMPSTQGEIVHVARVGEKMEILEEMGQWLKVKTPSGAVGYVWGNSVRVQKIIRKIPASPKLPNPPPFPVKDSKPFNFNFGFNYASVNPGDFNAETRLNNFMATFFGLSNSGDLDHPLEELTRTIGGQGEFTYYFKENLGMGLGFSFEKGNLEGSATVSGNSGFAKLSQDLKASIYGPYLILYILIPSTKPPVEFYARAGYSLGKFSLDYLQTDSTGGNSYKQIKDITKGALNFAAGIQTKIFLSPGAGIFLSGGYRFLKFKKMKATVTTPSGSSSGNLYYVEYLTLPFLEVGNTPPRGPDVSQSRPAVFDFSGIYLNAGFYLNF